MRLYKNKYRIESTRLKNWEYSAAGFYFVTICIKNREHDFVNSTQTFQINDARQLPIVVPAAKQLSAFETLFQEAYQIKLNQFAAKSSSKDAEEKLNEIQNKLDTMVYQLYGLA